MYGGRVATWIARTPRNIPRVDLSERYLSLDRSRIDARTDGAHSADAHAASDAGGASGTVNHAVVPPCALRSMPATPPRKAALVATEETGCTGLDGGQRWIDR